MDTRTRHLSLCHQPAHTLVDVLAEHCRNQPHALAYTFLADGESIESQFMTSGRAGGLKDSEPLKAVEALAA